MQNVFFFFQSLARLRDGFQLKTEFQSDLWNSDPSLVNSNQSVSRHCSDVGSQTDISGDVSIDSLVFHFY